MVFLKTVLKYRPHLLEWCIASSVAVHLGLLGTVFHWQTTLKTATSSAENIPVDWITIVPPIQSDSSAVTSTALPQKTSTLNAIVSSKAWPNSHRSIPKIEDKNDKSLRQKTSSQPYANLDLRNSNDLSNHDRKAQEAFDSPFAAPATTSSLASPPSSTQPTELTTPDDSEAKPAVQSGLQNLTPSNETIATTTVNPAPVGRLQSSPGRSISPTRSTPKATPIPTPPPTPVPTPIPTPVPTPPPAPEVFQCLVCPPPSHYPQEARLSAHSGSVQVIIDVHPEGYVLSAQLGSSSGSGILDQAALDTVQTWQFTTTANGRSGIPVYVDFKLE
ncbi:MAG: TonB family protein [Prochlorotrichaceae cyanobacterium]